MEKSILFMEAIGMKSEQRTGEKIRLLRIQKGMSQEQLALHSGVNTSYLGQIERGEKDNCTIKTLQKIAAGLSCPLEKLIGNEETQDNVHKEQNAVVTILSSEELKQLIIDTIKDNIPDNHSNCRAREIDPDEGR